MKNQHIIVIIYSNKKSEGGEEMKIVTVMDNVGSENKALYHEHGLSFYIEKDDKNLMFDFGSGTHTFDNFEKLGLQIERIDHAIISHSHYDHAASYPNFVKKGLNCSLTCGENFFYEKYAFEKGGTVYLGNGFSKEFVESSKIPINQVSGMYQVDQDIYVVNNFKRKYGFEKIQDRFVIRKNEKFVKDDFQDEIALVIIEKEKLIVVVGCSHPGILNMLTDIKERFDMPIQAVIGGNHLVEADEERIDQTLECMETLGIETIGFNHCSGELLQKKIRERKDFNAVYLAVGSTMYI